MVKATQRATLSVAYTPATAEEKMWQLHRDLEAGRASRETAIIELATMTEQGLFDVAQGDKVKNAAMYGYFGIFRDGAKAQETSDMSLRSKALKVCLAAQLCRGTNNLFTGTLATVADLHADATTAAKKDKKLPEDEQAGLDYPRQLIEAFYEAAKLQVESGTDEPIDEDVLRSDKVVAKPGKGPAKTEYEQFVAYINAIVEKFNPLVGSIDPKGARPKKLGLSQSTIDGLKSYRNELAKLAQPVTAADLQAAKDKAELEALRAEKAAAEAKKAARDAKKNGTPAK